MIRTLCAALALGTALTPLAAQDTDDRAPMSAQDLVTMPRLGAPIVAPDHTRALYQVTVTDSQSYARSRETYLRSLTDMGARPVRVTLPEGAHDLQFGADGQLYFLAPSGDAAVGHDILYRAVLGADGTLGAVANVADFGMAVDGYVLSPRGNAVAIFADVPRACDALPCVVGAERTEAGDGRLYEGDGGFIRHWDTWEEPGRLTRLFRAELSDGKLAGPLTAVDASVPVAARGDTPTKPFGGTEDIRFSPDGSRLYFVARASDAQEPGSTNLDIWEAAGGEVRNLTEANRALDALPTPSPDGRSLAYVAMARPGYESDRQVVMVRDLATGRTRALTQDFDVSFGSLAWTPDSRSLIATAQSVLDTPAFSIDARSGAVQMLDLMAGNEAHIGNVMPLSGKRLLFTRDSIGAPAELFLSNDYAMARPLTTVAQAQLAALAPIVTERFSFTGAHGDQVWGQITKLENHDGPLPAILYVHGGPQGSFNDGWSSRWNPRVVASQGYAVISVDFHGSTGYGQAFTDSINRDWGGAPLEDLKLGLAAALARDSQIDGERACAMGASYGGYMMNWIAGNWADRFDCLVQHDGLFDLRSFYYATEELWFPRWDFGGSYAENAELYERWNPVNHVDKWQTPMLVVAGVRDFRVPYTQGIQSFTALQERNIPSQLLVFEDENHWVLGAGNSLQWHETVFDWLARWLKPDDE